MTTPNLPPQAADKSATPETLTWHQSASNVAFALSLTAIMGAALFVTVAFNPKADTYGNLPWYYSGGCIIAAAALHVCSQRLGQKDRPAQSTAGFVSPPANHDGRLTQH